MKRVFYVKLFLFFLLQKVEATYTMNNLTPDITLRVQEVCANGRTQTELSIGTIQIHLNTCHPSCLTCDGDQKTSCKSCDTNCATLNAGQCMFNQSGYVLQEGSCQASCNSSLFFFENSQNCFKIPSCIEATNAVCTKCESGKYLIPNFPNQTNACVEVCPAGYSQDEANKSCIDLNKYSLKFYGTYFMNAFFGKKFSSIEYKKNNLNLTGFQSNMRNELKPQSVISKCGDYQLLGGYLIYQMASMIRQTAEVITQNKFAMIRFKYYIIDFPIDKLTVTPLIKVNIYQNRGQSQYINISSAQQVELCGLNGPAFDQYSQTTDLIGNFEGIFYTFIESSQSKIQLQIEAPSNIFKYENIAEQTIHSFFGIRELSIYFFDCTLQNCKKCSGSNCVECADGAIYVNNTCIYCLPDCVSCSNETSCTTCKYGRVWSQDSNSCVCPNQNQYFDNTTKTCKQCQPTDCAICDQASPFKCQYCNNSKYLHEGSCISGCPEQYYQNPIGKCQPCTSDCKICPSVSTCTTCNDSFYLDKNGLCVSNCGDGFFQDTNLKQCVSCTDNICQKCPLGQNVCESCLAPKVLQGAICKDQCDTGYFRNAQNICIQCSTQYSSCELCNSSFCTQCTPSKLLVEDKCEDQCPKGYYKVTGQNKCLRCLNQNCGTCDEGSSACRTCDLPSYPLQQGDGCVNSCSPSYYQNNLLCLRCSDHFPYCDTCSSVSCLTCINSLNFLNPNSDACVTACNNGTYKDETQGQQKKCLLCSTNCKTCSGSASNCLSCFPNYVMQGTQCQTDCNPTYYADNQSNCQLCKDKFLGCGKCTFSQCNSCHDPTHYLVGDMNKCFSVCPNGYATDPNLKVCVKCINNDCQTCELNNLNNCLSCYNQSTKPYLQQKQCVGNCSSNEYLQNNIECISCTSTYGQYCQQCNSIRCTLCDQSSSNKYQDMITNTCVSSCPQSTYNNLCVPNCNNNCLTCNPPNLNDCTSCKQIIPNIYLNGTTCQPSCNDNQYEDVENKCQLCSTLFQGCFKCNINSCLECLSTSEFFDPVVKKCGTTCSDGYYQPQPGSFNLGCQKCTNPNCKTCDNNPNECTSCEISSTYPYLQEKDCVQSCTGSKYLDWPTQTCLPCQTGGCKACISSYQCLECNIQLYLSPRGDYCTSSNCPNNTYKGESNGILKCLSCDNQACKTCDLPDRNLCTSCYYYNFLENNNCISSCSVGYYHENTSNVCIKCSTTFQHCSLCTETSCSQCESNYLFVVDQQNCVSTCPPGYFQLNNKCEKCSINCVQCTDQNNCTICNNSTYLQGKICQNSCNVGYFGDNNRVCQICSSQFQNCTECIASSCLTCNNPYLLNTFTGKCVAFCEDNYYQEVQFSQQTCEKCSNIDCKTCNSQGDCLTCYSNSQYPYLNVNTCTDQCPIYYNPSTQQCVTSCQSPTIPNSVTKICQICNDYVYQNTCYQTCPLGTQVNISLKTCISCSLIIQNCQYCSQSMCTKCQNPYLLQINFTCALGCLASQFIHQDGDRCVTKCETDGGYYADSSTQSCKQCNMQECLKCVDQGNKCIECHPNKLIKLDENKCYASCPIGTYVDTNTKQCLDCGNNCLLCSNIQSCMQCQPSYLYYNGSCVQSCPPNTFIFGKVCLDHCPPKTFKDSQLQQCQNCQNNCAECNELSICIKCESGYTLTPQNPNQSPCSQCTLGYYQNQCLNKVYPGPTPQLKVLEQATKINSKILITGTLSFDKKVKMKNVDNWKLKLDLENESNYQIKLIPQALPNMFQEINEFYSHLYNHQFSIKVEIDENMIDSYSTLSVDFLIPENVIEENGSKLTTTLMVEKLPKYTKGIPRQQSIGENVIKSLLFTSQLLFAVTTPLYQVANFFDLIQMINYMLYLNVQYPTFLYSVLKLFDYANFELLPNIQNKNSQSPYKFKIEKVDTFIYCNLIQVLIIWTISLLLYLASSLLQKTKAYNSNNFFFKAVKSYKENYNFKIIIGIGYLTYCDLILAVFLQFYDDSNITPLQIFGIISSLVVLGFILLLNYLSFRASQINIIDLVQNPETKKVYGYLYNGLNICNTKPIVNFVFLIRKTVIIYQLVFNQSNPIIQTFICSLMFGFELTFIAISRPYRNKSEQKLSLITRALLIICLIFTIILSIDDTLVRFSLDIRNALGMITSLIVITIYVLYLGFTIKQLYTTYNNSRIVSDNKKLMT